MRSLCRRCGDRYSTAEGYAMVYISRGDDALTQLRSGKVVSLCPECAEALASWIGISPVEVQRIMDPPAYESNGLPARPYSHYFEP